MKYSDRGKGDTSWVMYPPTDIPSLRMTEEESQIMASFVKTMPEAVLREQYKHIRELIMREWAKGLK